MVTTWSTLLVVTYCIDPKSNVSGRVVLGTTSSSALRRLQLDIVRLSTSLKTVINAVGNGQPSRLVIKEFLNPGSGNEQAGPVRKASCSASKSRVGRR